MPMKLIPEWALPLTGRTTTHLFEYQPGLFLSEQTALEFDLLKSKAKEKKITLEIISGFRSYERQVQIWNRKITKGLEEKKDPEILINEVLRWSALPGTSRHHWGTDIDVFDSSKMEKKEVKLEPFEYEKNGPFEALTDFLNLELSHFGFYRPYDKDRGGVACELWHLSFEEEARAHMEQFTLELYRLNIEVSELLLKDELLTMSEDLYQRYFLNIG